MIGDRPSGSPRLQSDRKPDSSPVCGVAVSNTTERARAQRPSTASRRSRAVAAVWASSMTTRSQSVASSARVTSGSFTKSSDVITTGSTSQGLTSAGREAERRRSPGASMMAAGIENRSSSSCAHCSRSPAGVTISARAASCRALSSAMTSAAWIVLPRPTPSAISTRAAAPRTRRARARTDRAAGQFARRLPPGAIPTGRPKRQEPGAPAGRPSRVTGVVRSRRRRG